MTLKELAEEYRDCARLLKERIILLREKLNGGRMCEMEKFRLRGRIAALEGMYRDTREAATVMEHYYDRGYKRNGRFLV